MGSVFDVDNYVDAAVDFANGVADVATSVVDRISDAGHAIGAVLKFVAPIVALWPGIGTGLSIALSAAGAYAAGDKIDEAIIEIAGNAIPGGVPRVAFDAAADITETALHGGSVKEAVLRSCRSVAQQTGGDRAALAFDTGLNVARGARVGDAAWNLARAQAMQGGAASVAAFDVAFTLAQGGTASAAALAVARDYVSASGGPLAAAAFDGGVAIAMGKSLQDAGFASLKAFVSGNELGERAVAFAAAMTRAAQAGQPLGNVLAAELTNDVERYSGAVAGSGALDYVRDKLDPIIQRWDVTWGNLGSRELASYLRVDEVVARAAQAIMRDLPTGGQVDDALHERLTMTPGAIAVKHAKLTSDAASSAPSPFVAARRAIATAVLSTSASAVAPSPILALAASARTSFLAPVIHLAPAPVAAPAPAAVVAEPEPVAPSPRNGTASDVALGLTIATACVALAWWATSK